MKRFLQLYRMYLHVNLTRYLTYRLETFIWIIGTTLPPIVLLAVWRSAAIKAGGTLSGFTAGEVAAYFIAVMLVNHTNNAWAVFLFESYVREGYLSNVLLRPNGVAFQDFGENIAYKLVTTPYLILTAIGLYFTFHPQMAIVPWAIVAFVPAFLMSFAIRYIFDWITASTAALHLTKVDAVNSVYFFVILLFSGQLAPIDLLPHAVRSIAVWLPFRWIIDFPVQLLMGRLTPHQAMNGFLAQAFWLSVLVSVNLVTWRKNLRNYTAVGI
jgi:ABC-2 type transport system permease protein